MSGAQPLFAALGDPTRFQVLSRLAQSGPATATDLARGLPVTRQAVSKHLTSLADAGLVERSRVGREVRWEFTPDGLADVVSWVESVGSEWDRRLHRLKREID